MRVGRRGHADRDHDRRGLPPVGGHRARPRRRRSTTTRSTSSRSCASSASTATPRTPIPDGAGAGGLSTRARSLGRGARAGHAARLPQRAGHRARAHRHHRVHDGLRHDRHRAGHRARQVQEAGRRGLPQDRQQDRPGGAAASSATPRSRSRRSSSYIDENETIEGAPGLKPEHLPVFDCAFKPVNGERSIHYMGHVRMMAAVPAVHVRRHQQDRQHARGGHRRGHRGRLPGGLEARPQGHRHLPRRLQAHRSRCPRARRRTRTQSPRPRSAEARPRARWRAKPYRRRLPDERQRSRTSSDRRARGLHHGRPLRGRHAGRDLPEDGQGGLAPSPA